MKAKTAAPKKKPAVTKAVAHKTAAKKPQARKAPAKDTSTPRPVPGKSAGKRFKAKKSVSSNGNLAPARIRAILDRLQAAYPNAECALHHRNAWELLVATILSAQCTDARVNMVTPELFRKFPTPQAMAQASLPALEAEIKSTGFYRNKAKSISGAAKKLLADFGGKVPNTMAELLTVPGAARKTANVVLGVAYKIAEGIVVDTHVLRLSNRLGLTQSNDPKKVEQELMQIIPRDHWIQFAHELIHHGRQVCIARKPRCADCTLESLCNAPDKTWSSH
ncbi:MAG TPA: endonuclease III [Acidobacteriaceae bacterium]|nr:endonuclease III [Acidobacteriaceae bacterium]